MTKVTIGHAPGNPGLEFVEGMVLAVRGTDEEGAVTVIVNPEVLEHQEVTEFPGGVKITGNVLGAGSEAHSFILKEGESDMPP